MRLDEFGWGRNIDRDIWAPPPDAAPSRSGRKIVAKKAGAKKAAGQKTTARRSATAKSAAATKPPRKPAAMRPR